VTLNIAGKLRGCIGSLQAHRPLVLDVAHNAQSAAFQDPRFSPLSHEEYQQVDIHISILSQPVPLTASSTDDLAAKLRPGIDGLIIKEGSRQATYLPSVWEQINDPTQFIMELRRKAGLDPKGWHDTEVLTYTTEEFC
jgi:AmmeMemoRadiSam system protein A